MTARETCLREQDWKLRMLSLYGELPDVSLPADKSDLTRPAQWTTPEGLERLADQMEAAACELRGSS